MTFALGAQAQDVDARAMVEGGLQAVQMIDQNKVGELWDGAAPAARARVKRAEFIEQVNRVRTPLGAPQQRAWVAINRQMLNDADPDLAGQYVSVEYESKFSNAVNRNVREMTSFHLDRDGVWRFSGYVLR
ncbi:MAG: DUF4019 domain-containing protein [Comamonadaceae bacterium]|nr:MAG: DUF4019 domain-containing protein [Comamonadaceae bacterium]